jgi:hypothetical protein
VLSVKVDGDVIGSITEPVFAEGAYFQRIVVLDEFADGLPHEVKLEYVGPVGGGLGTFTVDDIRLVLWQVPVLLDGGLEATVGPPWSNPFWDETSIQVGTPLCGPGCPGAGPRSGDDWAWFGGIGGPLPEVSTISQSVRLPRAAFIDLDFWLWISSVSAPFTDVLNTRVDGVLVDSIAEPGAAGGGYTLRTDFLDAYADGGEHVLMLEYIKGASGNFASFNVDDISLEIFRCNAIHLDNFETHDLSNWTVVFP